MQKKKEIIETRIDIFCKELERGANSLEMKQDKEDILKTDKGLIGSVFQKFDSIKIKVLADEENEKEMKEMMKMRQKELFE